jgi:hypothetical protein
MFCLQSPQGRLRSNKLSNRPVSCELFSDLISSQPSTSRNPIKPHSVLGRDVIQRLSALSYQWRCCFGGQKIFQSHLSVRPNTYIFLWYNNHLNFLSTGQDNIYLSLKTVIHFPRDILSLFPTDCP